MTIDQYIQNIHQRYILGNATEHTFRGDLQNLIESLVPTIRATNEPKRQSCGAPDYILTQKDIPVGFIEAKDIGDKDLEGAKKTGNKEQFDRYKESLNNLIFTDYLTFRLYRDGQFVQSLSIGEVTEKGIKAVPENFARFESFIKDFCTHIGQTIKSSKKLAEMMAGKARLLADVIDRALTSDESNQEDSTLKDQMTAFKQILIHDITPKGFADVYAQTIAYGMFAARYHDPTLPTFSRQEAYELIPKSNPFLKKLFGYIAGLDVDDRIRWIVDDLIQIFLACNVEEMLKTYGKSTKMEDPIIHFYEDFLSEYDPKLRKARGVWYTPQPVVNFIVRAVDDILKTEFDKPQGLADNSKTKIKVNVQGKMVDQEVHKVQILDPATGTGTFLAEVIKLIHQKFQGQQGIWSQYVDNHLLPRLNGFELLMASYAMAHLKLDLLLTETGYKPSTNQRFRVYLTNSLEESHPDTGTLFANWLSTEANEANYIKRDTPVMCVIGNPPYSVSSSNKGLWIEKLVEDYKKDLNEKSYNSLSDDYVKFIRYGQYFIDKNGSGVLAYISNNSFIDGISHRQMRRTLLQSFDKIYVLDLHGNAKKKEVSPDGSIDQNVFDIMQGVSINIFVKKGNKSKKTDCEIYHYSLYGKRDFKYDFLFNNNINDVKWVKLDYNPPEYFFAYKNLSNSNHYGKGFGLSQLMKNYNPGSESGRDDLFIGFDNSEVENRLKRVYAENFSNEIKSQYNIYDTDSFKLETNIKITEFDNKYIKRINYRPFDYRSTYYNVKIQRRPSYDTFKHILKGSLGIIFKRGFDEFRAAPIFIIDCISDRRGWTRAGMQGAESICPLYFYYFDKEGNLIKTENERTPNLNLEIVREISDKIGLTFVPEKEENHSNAIPTTFAPIDILDYIYAVLHSPSYREKYKEFLKIDFPRVPYPKDVNTFWTLVRLGGEIRTIHLLENPKVNDFITQYPIDGDNVVRKIRFEENYELIDGDVITILYPAYPMGRVYINDDQFFQGVPLAAWEFYIGGYQPAQKWLKDRKDRTLDFEDILHYQKVIVALFETDRIMKEIDEVEIE